ncbi:MAG: hypothetical protein LKE89_07090 [Lactobacillaceae bacterium]|jgi:hypothetical protein|nr:hypothetical protein [Lactobacillaceae bacterium]
MTDTLPLNSEVQALLQQERERIAPQKLTLEVAGPDSLVLDPTASKIIRDPQNGLHLMIPNPRFANFIVAHELLHLQQEGRQSIKISSAHQDHSEIDQVLLTLGRIMLESAVHVPMRSLLVKLGALDQPTQLVMRQYYTHNLLHDPQQAGEGSTVMANSLQLFDARIFLTADQVAATDWANDYPQAWQLAEQLLQIVTARDLKTNRDLRGTLLKLLKLFAEKQAGLPVEFSRDLLVTPVLSSRELNLRVDQLFQLWHDSAKKSDYLVISQKDDQATWRLSLAPQQQTQAAMLQRYQLTVAEFCQQYHFDYAPRDAAIFAEEADK